MENKDLLRIGLIALAGCVLLYFVNMYSNKNESFGCEAPEHMQTITFFNPEVFETNCKCTFRGGAGPVKLNAPHPPHPPDLTRVTNPQQKPSLVDNLLVDGCEKTGG